MNRSEKLSDRDTIIYEIDMLDHCYKKLVQEHAPNIQGYLLLECFLLHYRNLLDFFGKEPHRDDLSICNPEDWAPGPGSDKDGVQRLGAKGRSLWQEYEDRRRRSDTISRYLHHCTKQRTEAKDWPVREMYSKIAPLIQEFLQILGHWQHVVVDRDRLVVGGEGMSTMTVQRFNLSEKAGW